jgi:hypothetical protein
MSDNTITFFYPPQREDSDEDDAQHQPSESEKPLGFNFRNSQGILEPLAHGARDWQDHHFYELLPGYFPVRYHQVEATFVSENPRLPVFQVDYLRKTECLHGFFLDGELVSSSFLFVMFTSDDLRSIEIEVPEDHTGYQIDTSSGNFVRVPMPENHGWNPFFRRYEPVCTVEHLPGQKCSSGNLVFWESYEHHMTGFNPVFCSSQYPTHEEGRNGCENPLKLLGSNYGGPCCIQGCYCDGCRKFYPPEESQDHDWSESKHGQSTRNCDTVHSPR